MSALDYNQLVTINCFIDDFNKNKLSCLEIKKKYNLQEHSGNSYHLRFDKNKFFDLNHMELRFFLKENQSKIIFSVNDGKGYNDFQFFYEINNLKSFYGFGFFTCQKGSSNLLSGTYIENEEQLYLDNISKSPIKSFMANEEFINIIMYNHKDLNFIKESLNIIYDINNISDHSDILLLLTTLDNLNKEEKLRLTINDNKI